MRWAFFMQARDLRVNRRSLRHRHLSRRIKVDMDEQEQKEGNDRATCERYERSWIVVPQLHRASDGEGASDNQKADKYTVDAEHR